MGKKSGAHTRRSFGTIRQRSSGRFTASYADPRGGDIRYRAPRSFQTRDDAIAWLAGIRRSIDLETWTPPDAPTPAKAKALTVEVYARRWLEQAQGRLKPRTAKLYEGYITNVIAPSIGADPLKSLTLQHVREWVAGLDTRYPTRNANTYALLRTICGQAVEDGLLEVNPCRVRGAAVKHRKIEPVALSASEITELANGVPKRYRALLLLAGNSGLRFGELSALTRADLVLKRGGSVVHVRRGVTWVDGEPVVARPKSEQAIRAVPLPDAVLDTLREHVKTFVSADRDSLVFEAVHGGHMQEAVVREHLRNSARSMGCPTLRMHDLRHSFATNLARSGASLSEHMMLMGHSSPAMSARYISAGSSVSDRMRSIAEAAAKSD